MNPECSILNVHSLKVEAKLEETRLEEHNRIQVQVQDQDVEESRLEAHKQADNERVRREEARQRDWAERERKEEEIRIQVQVQDQDQVQDVEKMPARKLSPKAKTDEVVKKKGKFKNAWSKVKKTLRRMPHFGSVTGVNHDS